MRDAPFETIEELEAYTGGPQIQCLECGKWFKSLATHLPRIHGMSHNDYRQKWGIPKRFALAGTATREKLSEQMHGYIKTGRLTHDHLDSAVEAARAAGRGQKAPVDLKRQSEMTAAIRPGDHSILPPGAKRADGRDADRAREYQRLYRAESRPLFHETPGRRSELNLANKALLSGDPMPWLKYYVKYEGQFLFSEDEDDIIREKYPDWGPLRVAILLKRTPSSVRSRAAILKVRSNKRVWSSELDPQLTKMVDQGFSLRDIGKELGFSAQTISIQKDRLGLKMKSISGRKKKPRK